MLQNYRKHVRHESGSECAVKYGDVLTMRMNGDQKRRAETMVAVLLRSVAPAFSGALCAALALKGGEIMYWSYWKRGWWSWLMQLCQNLISMILFVPLALLFGDNKPIYFFSAALVAIIGLVPIAGWLFEVFARKSERIIGDRH